ncbi:ArsR family transcriptional regulator [Paenibacillus sp. N3/727]|uniref:ArsR/SmtB family transcription factor n=1 Tax=Paenibacillus sp. N3/727 TaxID=2925845 RepID=UPI001F537533|nr:ArsR family transcriptional regulator [Paenibacillus sp. N3/727]UNK18810.1 ArsR family transcriptional regulator [Paenibacillus sp. N3/727]
MKIPVSIEQLAFYESLGSETRLRIIDYLRQGPHNIKDLAEKLQFSSAIITKHIQKLEEAGIVQTENVPGIRGVQKRCSLKLTQVELQFQNSTVPDEATTSATTGDTCSIPIGQYVDYQITPTCGLASRDKLIGIVDDPRYFADPEHVKAGHLWLASGYVEYRLPNYSVSTEKLSSLRISLELCSEAPGFNEDWPSDITFSLNGKELLTWTCPGDFGDKKGRYSPPWWTEKSTQYGLLKTLLVTHEGTFLDGVRMSDLSIRELAIGSNQDIRLRIASLASARHPGGVSLFGRGFGNYDQDIEVTWEYQ